MDLKNLFGYEGKTVVVSGAYSGMGLAAARLPQELGANFYTICRRNGRHSKACEEKADSCLRLRVLVSAVK